MKTSARPRQSKAQKKKKDLKFESLAAKATYKNIATGLIFLIAISILVSFTLYYYLNKEGVTEKTEFTKTPESHLDFRSKITQKHTHEPHEKIMTEMEEKVMKKTGEMKKEVEKKASDLWEATEEGKGKIREYVGQVKERIKGKAEEIKEKVIEIEEKVKEKKDEFVEKIRDTARMIPKKVMEIEKEIVDKSKRKIDELKHRTHHVMEDSKKKTEDVKKQAKKMTSDTLDSTIKAVEKAKILTEETAESAKSRAHNVKETLKETVGKPSAEDFGKKPSLTDISQIGSDFRERLDKGAEDVKKVDEKLKEKISKIGNAPINHPTYEFETLDKKIREKFEKKEPSKTQRFFKEMKRAIFGPERGL